LFVVTEDWYFCSHRLAQARAALAQGYEVSVATRVDRHRQVMRDAGIRLIALRRLRRRSANPWREWLSLWELWGILRRERPDIVHLVALKPVIYGGIAARLTGIRVVAAIAGLGHLFAARDAGARCLGALALRLFRLALGAAGTRVIVQNPEDREALTRAGVVSEEQCRLIRGAGVDLEVFVPRREPAGPVTVMLASRLLWTKGVGEFVEAARILAGRGSACRFVLVGIPDPENPARVPEDALTGWVEQGLVEWWGHRDDMPDVLGQAHIGCLPSYREGLPKALLEAAACARPLVASDAPGCREICVHEETGLLVPPRDPVALAGAIERLAADPDLRRRLGRAARERVEREFSIARVAGETLALYDEVLQRG